MSKTSSRLPHEVHEKVFGWVLVLIAEGGLVKGERIGVDGSTMEANAGAANHRAAGGRRDLSPDGAVGFIDVADLLPNSSARLPVDRKLDNLRYDVDAASLTTRA